MFSTRERFASTTRISALIAVHCCIPLPLMSPPKNKRLGCVEHTPKDRLFSGASVMVCPQSGILCISKQEENTDTWTNLVDMIRGEINRKRKTDTVPSH